MQYSNWQREGLTKNVASTDSPIPRGCGLRSLRNKVLYHQEHVPLWFEVLAQAQQASTVNIQSTRGSGAVANRFEELAQQGFILYIVLHWSANNNVDYNSLLPRDYVLLRLKGVAWLTYGWSIGENNAITFKHRAFSKFHESKPSKYHADKVLLSLYLTA